MRGKPTATAILTGLLCPLAASYVTMLPQGDWGARVRHSLAAAEYHATLQEGLS